MEDPAPGAVQSFYNSIPSYAVNSDPVFSIFKRPELDATVAAVAHGKYFEFWTVERLAELNNTVDGARNCPEELKAIFSGTKNPRIRGNKIGALVYNRLVSMMKGGLPAEPSDPAPTHEITIRTVSSTSSPPRPMGTNNSSQGGAKYVLAPDLPPDTKLRVRAGPTIDSELIGVIGFGDEVVALERDNDWLRVRIDGFPDNAWMMSQTPERQLLVQVGGGPVPSTTQTNLTRSNSLSYLASSQQQAAPPVPTPVPQLAPPPLQQTQPVMVQQAPPLPAMVHVQPQQPTVYSSMPAFSAPQQQMMYGQNPMLAQSLSVPMSPSMHNPQPHLITVQPMSPYGGGSNGPRPLHPSVLEGNVSVATYQELEQRVAHLEAEMRQLKLMLRSV